MKFPNFCTKYKEDLKQYNTYHFYRKVFYIGCALVFIASLFTEDKNIRLGLIILMVAFTIIIGYDIERVKPKKPKYVEAHTWYIDDIETDIRNENITSLYVNPKLLGTNYKNIIEWIKYRCRKTHDIEINYFNIDPNPLKYEYHSYIILNIKTL